jgi:hypothetical protein
LLQDEIGGRRDQRGLETERDWRIGAGAESDPAGSVHNDTAAGPAQLDSISAQSVSADRHDHVALEHESVTAGLELHPVRAKAHRMLGR